MKTKKIKFSRVLIYITVILMAVFCLLPMALVLITSFTSEAAILKNGYSFIPESWSLEAYKTLFAKSDTIIKSYIVTTFVTIAGTFLSVLITYTSGFVLANQQFKYRNGFALFFFITTIFSAGLVPQYLIIKNMGMYDTLWALIIPGCFSPFNMFLVRNFVNGVPFSLMESARVDGAGLLTICGRIYMPISKPVIATITLFYGIGYWNNYFNSLMFVDKSSLHTLQMILFRLQSDVQMMKQLTTGIVRNPPAEGIKMATAVITIGPIILLYPFLQKYFIKGIIVGAVKG